MIKQCESCSTYPTEDTTRPHTNAFMVLNGVPYLIAEYVDRQAFEQLHEASVESDLVIDTSDCTRTIIDISINDIGNTSDGSLNTLPNTTMQQNLLTAIQNNFMKLKHQLPVMRRGIIARVNYQLENQRTGTVIRSMVEELRMPDRGYFLDIDGTDISSGTALVTNFSNTIVSTVAQFTHGLDPMVLRITKIQLFYECVKPHPFVPHYGQSIITDPDMVQYFYGCDADVYKMHEQLQHQHILSSDYCCTDDDILPSTWEQFNRFYHFDTEMKDAVIHDEEVYDGHVRTGYVACGIINVNRSFLINPGSRLIFKFSIWKNDVVLFNDCSKVMNALGISTNCNCGSGSGSGDTETTPPDDGTDNNVNDQNNGCACEWIPPRRCVDAKQDAAISDLSDKVDSLIDIMKEMHPDNEDLEALKPSPTPPVDPLTALTEQVAAMATKIEDMAKRLANAVDKDYLGTLVNELDIAPKDNPPKFATSTPAHDDGSTVTKDALGNEVVNYKDRSIEFVSKTDPEAPSKEKDGWWPMLVIHAPEDLNTQDAVAKVKMRLRRDSEAWEELSFKDGVNERNIESGFLTYNLYLYLDVALLKDAWSRNTTINYELQCDWNGNGTYENIIRVVIDPKDVVLYDAAGTMVWPLTNLNS